MSATARYICKKTILSTEYVPMIRPLPLEMGVL